LGVKAALERDAILAAGLNIAAGEVAHRSVSDAHDLPLAADWHRLVSA
ncbi:alanine dehydrogenase, partial [Arthrobacter sp. SDTb3-6]|nr:alanine dehydrogenase [Arthrobacter sp. SDTb3-6]